MEDRWSIEFQSLFGIEEIYVRAGEIAYKYQMRYTYKKYIGYLFVAIMIIGIINKDTQLILPLDLYL